LASDLALLLHHIHPKFLLPPNFLNLLHYE